MFSICCPKASKQPQVSTLHLTMAKHTWYRSHLMTSARSMSGAIRMKTFKWTFLVTTKQFGSLCAPSNIDRGTHCLRWLIGVITFTAPYLPWVLLVLAVLLGANPVQCTQCCCLPADVMRAGHGPPGTCNRTFILLLRMGVPKDSRHSITQYTAIHVFVKQWFW